MRQRIAAGSVSVATPAQPGVTSDAAPARLGYVDGLRALAALYVVIFHIGFEVWGRHGSPTGIAHLLALPFQTGHPAVSVFIVLSGFSLMLPIARKGYRLPWGIGGFYWRRARRILPPYYFAIGLSLLLAWLFISQPTGTIWDGALHATWRDVLQHMLLVNDFALDGGQKINYVFWSVAMECQIYLLFPALILLWRRYPPLVSTTLVVALSLILVVVLALTWIGRLPGYLNDEFDPQYIGLFSMGMFAASVYTAPSPHWIRLRDWRLWETLALVSGAIAVAQGFRWPLYVIDVAVGASVVGLLLAASRPGRLNIVRAALEWRPLVWIGGFSYSLYLIHAPLIQVIWQYALHPLSWSETATYLTLLLVGLPLIVLASWGFWYLCERPFLNSRAGRTATAAFASLPGKPSRRDAGADVRG
ncbi:MAG: acyltransferase [Chloroflexota bacterium]|nr:acyltransferase [Chloroflexota bacterium]